MSKIKVTIKDKTPKQRLPIDLRLFNGLLNIFFILDENNNPIPENDLLKWAEWMEGYRRPVGTDTFTKNGIEYGVSTIFLGTMSFFGSTLFETLIEDSEGNHNIYRYETWAEAEEGHKEWVRKLQSP